MASTETRRVAWRSRSHVFDPDSELSERYLTIERQRQGLGPRQWCRRCGLPGEPGDERHAEPSRAALADGIAEEIRRAELRRLGERDE